MTTTPRIANADAPRHIRTRKPFNSHSGSLTGRLVSDPYISTGILPDEEAKRLREDLHTYGFLYIVYSYATPIGWSHTGGELVIPDVRYSVTTSRHQSLVRQAAQ